MPLTDCPANADWSGLPIGVAVALKAFWLAAGGLVPGPLAAEAQALAVRPAAASTTKAENFDQLIAQG